MFSLNHEKVRDNPSSSDTRGDHDSSFFIFSLLKETSVEAELKRYRVSTGFFFIALKAISWKWTRDLTSQYGRATECDDGNNSCASFFT